MTDQLRLIMPELGHKVTIPDGRKGTVIGVWQDSDSEPAYNNELMVPQPSLMHLRDIEDADWPLFQVRGEGFWGWYPGSLLR